MPATDREAYLRAHSDLPGPRANLELLDVASAHCDRADLERWAALAPEVAPVNSPEVFLVCVGIVGLGRLVAAGDRSFLPTMRQLANDPRWRAREAVAIGLQAWGDADPHATAPGDGALGGRIAAGGTRRDGSPVRAASPPGSGDGRGNDGGP